MRLYSETIGKQVLSLSDGRRMGTVYDLYLDSEVRTITAIHLGYDDLFGGNAGLIERRKVTAFGRDATLTADPSR